MAPAFAREKSLGEGMIGAPRRQLRHAIAALVSQRSVFAVAANKLLRVYAAGAAASRQAPAAGRPAPPVVAQALARLKSSRTRRPRHLDTCGSEPWQAASAGRHQRAGLLRAASHIESTSERQAPMSSAGVVGRRPASPARNAAHSLTVVRHAGKCVAVV